MRPVLHAAALPVAGLVLLLWAAACLVPVSSIGSAPLASLVAVAASTSMLVTLLAVPVITLAFRRHRWESLAAAVLAAGLPWVFLLPYASGDDRPATAEEPLLVRVMVVNAQDGEASAHDIAAAALSNRIDVLVVTELTGGLAHELTQAGLNRQLSARWVQLPGEDGTPDVPEAGMGVWSTVPAEQPTAVSGTRWPSVRVALPQAGINVIAAHVSSPLPFSGRSWASDLRTLRTAAAEVSGPTVLLGSLNATPWHADLRAFRRSGLSDAANVLGRGPRPSWPTWSPLPLLPLDHVIVSDQIAVESVESVLIGGSDHRGLLAALRVPAAPASS